MRNLTFSGLLTGMTFWAGICNTKVLKSYFKIKTFHFSKLRHSVTKISSVTVCDISCQVIQNMAKLFIHHSHDVNGYRYTEKHKMPNIY